MAERMAQVAAAAMFVRAAADPGTPDLTEAQRDLAAERSRDALAEAAAALGELLPVLLIRAEAGESVDRMLVEVDATPSPAAGPRADAEVAALRPLVPVAIIAMRLGAGPAAPEGGGGARLAAPGRAPGGSRGGQRGAPPRSDAPGGGVPGDRAGGSPPDPRGA